MIGIKLKRDATLLDRHIRDNAPAPAPAPPAADEWPVLDDAALHGPIGELVHVLGPHTESDPAAILVQSLVVLGSIIGPGPHFKVEGNEHHGNLYAAIIAKTSDGKGTSLGRVQSVFARVDSEWFANCIASGLSSGEGVIYRLRDEIVNAKGDVVVEGVKDKRLLIVETEFASMLKVMARAGNNLSPVDRNGWDRVPLEVLTKNSPLRATDPFPSKIVHGTPDETTRLLGDTECGSGFANRYLWVLTRRSQFLPNGGDPSPAGLEPIIRKLRRAVRHARTLGRVQRDLAAERHWCKVYRELATGKPGLLGAMIGRAAPQTVRLSLVYALADGADIIGIEHLDAALALWRYCEASARYIFGARLGDSTADEIMAALRSAPDGMSRDAIRREVFQSHRSSDEISRALGVLREAGLAAPTSVGTRGRAREVWRLAGAV